MLENRLEAVRLYGAIGHRLREECLPFLIDKKYPLAMRWALMTDMDRVGLMQAIDASSVVLKTFNDRRTLQDEITLFDDFYIERGVTKPFDEILEAFTPDTYFRTKHPTITDEEVEEWQEYILTEFGQRGFASFTYDW